MDVNSHMEEFIDWLGPASIDTESNVIEIAAACHARLAQIHPFVDGNGRTSRILMNLVLMRAGYPIRRYHSGRQDQVHRRIGAVASFRLDPIHRIDARMCF